MYQLSLCADTLYRELPFEERIKEIVKTGLMVEFWGWPGHDIDAIAAIPGIKIASFTGYDGGSIVRPEDVDAFIEGIKRTFPIAEKLKCKRLFLSTGAIAYDGKILYPAAAHPATKWITAYKALCRIAELAEIHDVTYNLEVLNTKVDHAGYALPLVEDVVKLLEQVNSPRIRMLFDIYHVQVEQGNLIQIMRDYAQYVGYIHVADVPGRHEPGTGEINYLNIAKALRDIGYDGVIGLEAFPLKDSLTAIKSFQEAFA